MAKKKPKSQDWNGWRELRNRPHLTFGRHELDGIVPGLSGALVGDCILIHTGLDQRSRHAALTHELVHDERRIFPTDPVGAAREEAIVHAIVRERLAPLEQVRAALVARGDEPTMPEDLYDEFYWAPHQFIAEQMARVITDGLDRKDRRGPFNPIQSDIQDRRWNEAV
jgi:hypothetical protein